MSEIKSLLKEARKHIDDQNFQEAQQSCKNILRIDKSNYLALVLLGKSFKDSEQAPLAYRKAIAEKPDQLLAWQGLANYYEKKDEITEKQKLIAIYHEILKLLMDDEKSFEYILKLGQLCCTLKNSGILSILLNIYQTTSNINVKDCISKQIIELSKLDILYESEDLNTTLNCLFDILDRTPSEHLEVLIGKLLMAKDTSAIEKVISLKFFKNNVILHEMVCKYLCAKFIEEESFGDFNIDSHIEVITDGVENSKFPELLRSMIAYSKSCFLEAYKKCVLLVNYNQADKTEVTFLLKCCIKLKNWAVAQKLATIFLSKTNDRELTVELNKIMFLVLYKQMKYRQAIAISKEISLDHMSPSEKALLAECYIEENISADSILKELTGSTYFKQLSAFSLLKQEKYLETIQLVDSDEKDINLFYLGVANWNLKNYEKAQIFLLKSAQINSEHAETFLYLGDFYSEYKNDLNKARKCYEKAYSLNNNHLKIVEKLSTIYIKLNLLDIDLKLLQNVEKSIVCNASWVYFRLGLHYMSQKDWDDAILEFRNVVKIDSKNTTAIECMADAYCSRGSYTSALRSYAKVMSLDSKRKSHCLTKTAHIYSLLTEYNDAISNYKKALDIDPSSILALKGIAETWMRIAKKKLSMKLYGSARDSAQNAIDYIINVIGKQKEYLCLWKIFGDTLLFIAKLPIKYSYVSDQYQNQSSDLFIKAIACYTSIAKKSNQCASFDLAYTYYRQYIKSNEVVNCNIAYNMTLSCISLKPLNWKYWDLLGKICYVTNKYSVAQHCFIKALTLTKKWSLAKVWCNLGLLYLKLKLYKLANYCFWRGQSILPSYPPSWIGQGLIAETIRKDEAMDLFRHASYLGYHPESALGYADWVCRTLKNQGNNKELNYAIEGLHAIPFSIDLLEWYLTYNPNDACACVIIGILYERTGCLRNSYMYYKKALENASDSYKNIVLLNVARALSRLEKYEEAIVTYKQITEASLDSTVGLALALYKKECYEESYSTYDTALHWLCNDDKEKSDLLVAMAGVAYLIKGSDNAKTLLFTSIQVSQKNPTIHSLIAICSLGLLTADQGLSKLALSELKKFEKDSKHSFDTGFLKSYILFSNNTAEAIKTLSDSLHFHPTESSLWLCLAQYCLLSGSSNSKIASCCAKRAICSQNKKYNNSVVVIVVASIAEFIAMNQHEALRLAKMGIHLYPYKIEIWVCLLLLLVNLKEWRNENIWIVKVISHIRNHEKITPPIKDWVTSLEKNMEKQN